MSLTKAHDLMVRLTKQSKTLGQDAETIANMIDEREALHERIQSATNFLKTASNASDQLSTAAMREIVLIALAALHGEQSE